MTLISIKFKNFFSFKNEAKMNFLVNENAPQTNHFGSCNESDRFSKISGIFGVTSSGKTNFTRGARFLKWFIAQSFAYSEENPLEFLPFDTTKTEPTEFEVEFYIEQVFYKLSFTIDTHRVLSEVLESRREKDKRLITLYSRKYISDNTYEFEGKNIDLEKTFIEKVRSNSSIISTANYYNHPELTKLREHWKSVSIIIYRGMHFYRDEYLFVEHNMFNISRFYGENIEYFQQTKEFFKTADLGLSDLILKTHETADSRGDKEFHYFPYGIHKSKGKTFKVALPIESGGIQHLYIMLSFIFPILKKGSVFFIDDIERNLHPNILPTLFNLFTSKETNPKNAQLIYSTHTSTLMNTLSKYQTFLVEKNSDCESELYRLNEFSGMKK